MLPPSSVGEMTLRLYGALSYSRNSALVHNSRSRSTIVLYSRIRRFSMSIFKRTQRKYVKKAYPRDELA